MEKLSKTKEELRKGMLKERGGLDSDFICSAGTSALAQLRRLDCYLRAETVMLYMDYRNEFPTGPILSDLLYQGKTPVLPLTGPDFRITPYTLWTPRDGDPQPKKTESGGPNLQGMKKEDSFESPSFSSLEAPCSASVKSRLCPSSMGILEPNPRRCQQTDPMEIDLVIVPGVVFDRSGNRIGFGKACYDHFLPMLRSDVLKIGLAYEFQVLPQIPAEPTDISMDFIVTEASLYYTHTR